MIITTEMGTVEGFKCADSGSVLFAGIPYAAPPVGALRWKAPQPARPWNGVLKCDNLTRAAAQDQAPAQAPRDTPYGYEYGIQVNDSLGEDCLYLNIWTPAQAPQENAKLPVLVVIHGGGFRAGSGAVPVLGGARIAEQGFVAVTINYRLGIFGFLAHPDLSKESDEHVSGNYGILDQIAALRWVHTHIAAFSGDPCNITISGESAGAMSVQALYESPKSKGLFAKAAAQSGALIDNGSYFPLNSLAQEEQRGADIGRRLSAPDIAALRSLSADALIGFQQQEPFYPIRDGEIWPENVGALYKERRYNDAPLLLGANADEDSAISTPADPSLGERALAYETYEWAKLAALNGAQKVYWYFFDRAPPGSRFGAHHSAMLPYLYRNLDKLNTPWEEKDRRLSDTVSGYLMHFMRTGSPNGPDVPPWTDLAQDTEQVMELGVNVGMVKHPRLERYAFFKSQVKGA